MDVLLTAVWLFQVALVASASHDRSLLQRGHQGGGGQSGAGGPSGGSSGSSSTSHGSNSSSYSGWSITFGIFFMIILCCLIMRCCASSKNSNNRRSRYNARHHHRAEERIQIERELASIGEKGVGTGTVGTSRNPQSDAAPMDQTQFEIQTAESMNINGEIPTVTVVNNNNNNNKDNNNNDMNNANYRNDFPPMYANTDEGM